jgi:hypothetical protein
VDNISIFVSADEATIAVSLAKYETAQVNAIDAIYEYSANGA